MSQNVMQHLGEGDFIMFDEIPISTIKLPDISRLDKIGCIHNLPARRKHVASDVNAPYKCINDVLFIYSNQNFKRATFTLCIKQKRSTEGCSKFKSPETRQVQERLVSTLKHMQVPKWDRTRCPEE